ncbi:MAG TPA: MEDS domain-containing protein [Terriglobales bacterium]|nr:MEDS domain-containing protein [Terriglobales bacterium]
MPEAHVVEIGCEEVWRQISNYVENDLDPALRLRMEEHFKACKRCSAVLDGARNLVQLVGDGKAFDLPAGFSERLRARLQEHAASASAQVVPAPLEIPIGITGDRVPLGSHLIYFWESDQDFDRGVRFFHPGLGKGEHCIAFGHDEALEKVLMALRAQGYDPDLLIQKRELTVLRRHAAAEVTLSDISDVMHAALNSGSTAIRFLGNLGLGRDPLPAGENDVLELENRVDALITGFPCVVVCMYDVRTLPGRMILKGGLEQHRLAVHADGVHENPYYRPGPFSAASRHVH